MFGRASTGATLLLKALSIVHSFVCLEVSQALDVLIFFGMTSLSLDGLGWSRRVSVSYCGIFGLKALAWVKRASLPALWQWSHLLSLPGLSFFLWATKDPGKSLAGFPQLYQTAPSLQDPELFGRGLTAFAAAAS